MKKKLITACVMPFLAACGQNSSDIFTINDGRIDGLHAPWDGLDDDTKFRCSTDDSLFKFSFEVNDSTLTLEPEYKDKMSVIYEDRSAFVAVRFGVIILMIFGNVRRRD